MAAVTLKDLMDPLTKIQAATESSAESLDKLTLAVGHNGLVGGAVQSAILTELQLQTQLMKNSNNEGGGLSALFGGSGGKGKSKGLAEGGNAFKMLGAGTSDMAKGLLIFMLVPKKAVTGFNDFVRNQLELWGDTNPKDVEKGAEAMEAMGTAILTFSKALALSALLLIPAAIGIPILYIATALIVPLFLLLGKSSKQIRKGARAMDRMGDGLKSFAIGLAAFALTTFFILMQPKILFGMVATLILISGAVALIGMFSKQIRKGGVALAVMGIGLGIFAIGYAIFALTIMAASPTMEDVAMQAGILIGIGIVVAILGMVATEVVKGSLALAVMGIALIVFGIGYIPFSKAVDGIGLKDIGIQLAVLLGFGVVFALLGAYEAGLMTGIPLTITLGSIAIILIGVALLVFGIGYIPFAEATKDVTKDSVLQQVGLLGALAVVFALAGLTMPAIAMGAVSFIVIGLGLFLFGLGYTPFAKATAGATAESNDIQTGVLTALGTVFALAGLGVIPIVAGAVAFGAVGLALQELAPGLKAMKDVDFTQQDALNLTTTLAGVKTAFIGPPKGGGVGGFFKSIGGAIAGVVDSGGMAAAALGFAAAGLALTKLSTGLKDYKALDWTADDSLQLTTVLTGITTAFAAAGGEAAKPTGIFGAVFGNAFSPNATKKGISSVMDAGKALTSIVVGLTEFQKLVDKDIDFVKLGEDVEQVVGFIQTAFAAVGNSGNVEAGGFFGSLLGIEKNAVAEGIASVSGAGKALTGIAEGLMSFQDLVDSKVDFGNAKDPKEGTMAYAVSNTIGFVQTAFAAIGSEKNVDAGGFFGSLFGIKKNAVAEGIASVEGAGEVLKNIADALVGFQKLIDSKVVWGDPADPKPGTMAYAVINTIGFVQKAFAQIADSNEDGGWFSFDSNKVADGVAAVSGAGAELKNISDALIAFDGLKDPNGTAEKVETVLGLVGGAFASIGGGDNVNEGIFWDDNLVQLGIEAVEGAGDALKDIASGLAAFAGEFDPVRVADAVALLLTSIGTAFSDLYQNNSRISYQLRDFSSFVTQLGAVAQRGELDKAADGITKIAEAINKIDVPKTVAFGDLFKSAAALSKDGKAYFALIKAIDDIKDLMQQQPNLIAQAVQYLSPAAEKEKIQKEQDRAGRGTQYVALNKTLSSLSLAITELPTTLASMELVVTDPNR